jgi:hypothetical protein
MDVHPAILKAIMQILKLYSESLGLQINFMKSEFIPPSQCSSALHNVIHSILGCKKGKFLMSYLGLPLSIRAPTKINFIPLLNKYKESFQGS